MVQFWASGLDPGHRTVRHVGPQGQDLLDLKGKAAKMETSYLAVCTVAATVLRSGPAVT